MCEERLQKLTIKFLTIHLFLSSIRLSHFTNNGLLWYKVHNIFYCILKKVIFACLNNFYCNMPSKNHRILDNLWHMLSDKMVEFIGFIGMQNYDKITYYGFPCQAHIYLSLAFQKALISSYHSCYSITTNACIQLTPHVKSAFRHVLQKSRIKNRNIHLS